MQTPNRTPRRKAPRFLGVKILILSIAGAITIGFWNLLSNNAFVATTPPAVVTLSAQPPANVAQDLPPIPTIVPLINIQAPLTSGETMPSDQPHTAAVNQSLPLRVLVAPTIVIVQKSKPVIGAQVSNTASNSGGGGGSSSKSNSSTKSSK
ncbi:MAG TPA: hypothetical protein VKF38_13900 [Anaerolineaceae bacterium]|nr:hypothetical protein [Anaerolineaceae bacterium]